MHLQLLMTAKELGDWPQPGTQALKDLEVEGPFLGNSQRTLSHGRGCELDVQIQRTSPIQRRTMNVMRSHCILEMAVGIESKRHKGCEAIPLGWLQLQGWS